MPAASDITPAAIPRGSHAIGPAGALARVGVGVVLIALELFRREPRWHDAALGLVTTGSGACCSRPSTSQRRGPAAGSDAAVLGLAHR